MGKLYDRNFKAGFVVTVVLFVLANIVSFLLARYRYSRLAEGNKFFSEGGSLNWGFPFYWFGYSSYFFEDGFVGFVLNFVTAVGCAFAVGLAVRFMLQKVSRKSF